MWRAASLYLGCLFAVTGCQPAPNIVVNPNQDVQSRGLVLSGTATVRVKPTLVVLNLGASFTDQSPVKAKSQTEAAIKKVVAAVKGSGVAAEEIQTTAFDLSRYDANNNQPAGWRCSSTLEIRVKDVDRASSVLEAAMAAGANQVNRVEYTVEELQAVRAEARDEACKVAKEKADQYARNFGIKLGAPIYISESTPYGWSYGANSMTQSMINSAERTGQQSEQVLSSGSVEVKLVVHVTYDLPK